MKHDQPIEEYLRSQAKIINAKLEEAIQRESSDYYIKRLLGRSKYRYDNEAISKSILEPTWHLIGIGGKRWRPVLMALVIEAFGKNPDNYMEFCLIPEVIHNATLVHDDVEDDSPMRRGQPAVHVKYGIDIGVNLGDFLYYFPMVALIDSKKLSIKTKNDAIAVYVREMLRVCMGQATDIAWHKHIVDPFGITEERYLQMAYDKTGSLARMAAKLGAVIGGADQENIDALGNFGGTIGVAFQIQDDILNITESSVASTKGGVGDDISEGKITLVVIRTLATANSRDKQRLIQILKMHTKDKRLIKEAISIIDKYGAKTYATAVANRIIKEAWHNVDKRLEDSDAKNRLRQLAEFVVGRTI